MKHARSIGLAAAFALCATVSAYAGARHAVNLKLTEPVTITGATLAPGQYRLSWTETGSQADVTIAKGSKVVATAKGNVEQRDKAAIDDMVLFHKDAAGAQVLSEIRQRGEKAAIILSAS